MSDQPAPIPSTPASPDTQAWHDYRRSSEQQEPQRLEEAAKFLAGMASITFTLLLSTDGDLLKGKAPGVQALVSVAWMISLLLAFIVLFPRPYRYAKDSAASIERMHRRVVRWKAWTLIWAVVFFLLGFLLLAGLWLWVLLHPATGGLPA